ncbi:MAG: GNAT family N-acetyltransferase [Candidatus Riflebacteria bacterium]|nr:GNAT family N-acetyltransferase [Candidatus Riflebacteria bacterium]
MGNDLKLRRWRESDCRLIYDWRINPATMRWCFAQRAFSFDEHERWFNDFLNDCTRCGFMLEDEGAAVAQIRFDPAEMPGCYRISLAAAPDKSGQGYGSSILRLACNDEEVRRRAILLVAETMCDNLPSQKIFARSGFFQSGGGKNNDIALLCWVMPLAVSAQPLLIQFFSEASWLEDIEKLLSTTGLALPGDASAMVKVFLGSATSVVDFDASMLFHINFCENAILDLAIRFPGELKLPIEFHNLQTAVAQIAASLSYLQNCR